MLKQPNFKKFLQMRLILWDYLMSNNEEFKKIINLKHIWGNKFETLWR